MKRRKLFMAIVLAVTIALFSGCANLDAAKRAKKRVAQIPVASENLVLYGDKHVTVDGSDYSLPSLASKLLKGRKPDLYQNATIYGRQSTVYTVVYDRNNAMREEEGCNLALFRFDYHTRKAKLVRDMKGTFPVQSYNMATPSVLQYFDEDGGRCILVRNGALEIVSAETGTVLWTEQIFGAKDYFTANYTPFSFLGADMVCTFSLNTVKYYRYDGTQYATYTFENEAFEGLRSGAFGVAGGALYAEAGGEIVFAADTATGEARDLQEIAALVAEQEAERAAVREQGERLEQGGAAYRVKSTDGGLAIAPEAGESYTVDIGYLREHSEQMRKIEGVYAEEFPDRTLSFSVGGVISEGRLFLTADAEIQGYGLVSLYTPLFVFELKLDTGGIVWHGIHGGERLGGVRQL